MDIVIDIETIPDQSERAIDRFTGDDVRVTCPHKSKAAIGADLGMAPEEYKFIGAEDLKQIWVEKKGSEAKMAQAKDKWLKTSFDGAYGQICCISMSSGGHIYTYSLPCEGQLLIEFWSQIGSITKGRPPYFIAHNAKFDLPFIYHRSVVRRVEPVRGFKPHGRHGQDHFCTMEAWAGFNGKIGLDRLAGVLGIGSKTEGMSGAQVWPEYQKGNIDKIASYCRDDVKLTEAVYKRLTFK